VSRAPRIANLGAEEGDAWRRHSEEPAVAELARLWVQLVDGEPRLFDWLPDAEQAAAWLNTEEAELEAGAPLCGTVPSLVRTLHDKAFALSVASRDQLEPDSLSGLVRVLDAAELEPAREAAARIESWVAEWPEWTGRRFTLKPRFGSSGRGRIGGQLPGGVGMALFGALPRLASRGGAVLEPWLERTADLSAQLAVGNDGGLVLLGTTTLLTDPSGLYRGHLGTFDRKGRVTSGHRFDEPLREAAAAVALAAAAEGLRGPCGIDGFAFRGPDGTEELRPVCELNARYTAGTVVLGLVRRHLAELKDGLGLAMEERGWFRFAPLAPTGGWPAPEPGTLIRVLLDPGAGEAGPALCASRDRRLLDPL
jgi:hypothetical protein